MWWNPATVRWLTVGTFAAAAVLALFIPLLPAGEHSVCSVYRELVIGDCAWTVSFLLMTIGAVLRLRSVERLNDNC